MSGPLRLHNVSYKTLKPYKQTSIRSTLLNVPSGSVADSPCFIADSCLTCPALLCHVCNYYLSGGR